MCVFVLVVEDSLQKMHPLTAAGVSARDMEEEGVLLAPDDSLASHASLVSMAVYPSGQPIPQNVTTLVMSNSTALDASVASSLLPATPDYNHTMYRVKKLHNLSTDDVSCLNTHIFLGISHAYQLN